MNTDRWIACVALWLALSCQAMAHPPYIEPWKHGASIVVSGFVAVCIGVLVRKKFNLVAAIIVGGIIGVLCWIAGEFISIVTSM